MIPDLSFGFSLRQSCSHTVHQQHFPLQGVLMGRGWELPAAWPFQILLLPLVAMCPLAQLCQGQPCASGCRWLPEATAEVPVPTAQQDRTGIAQSANAAENRTLITPTTRMVLSECGLAGPFPGATEVPPTPWLSAPPRRATAPWDNG